MSTLFEQTKTKLLLMTENASIAEEIRQLIYSGIADLEYTSGVDVGGVTSPDITLDDSSDAYDILVAQAVMTYVKCHFGEADEYERLKRSYDEQKKMLKTASYGRDSDGQNS